MKEFNYSSGNPAGKTFTVSELKEFLDKYPDDMPVLATWEGTYNCFHTGNFEIEEYHAGDSRQECECLIIDVEY